MMKAEDIKEGGIYRGMLALWTVRNVAPGGRVFVVSDCGVVAQFGLSDFAQIVQERVDPFGSQETSAVGKEK